MAEQPLPLHVLVVDDDPAISRSIKIVLEQQGLHVDTSRDAREALDLLEHTEQPIDLLLVDIKLPDISGDELARQVHQRDQQMPIVLCSGIPSVSESQWPELGVRGFLQKPYKLEEVLELIERLLGSL